MDSTYRIVKLQKNHIYPTYQFHGFMANQKTTPQDGLRLAALMTIEWLRQRLGEDAPEELKRAPEPALYRECGNECLSSLHIHMGLVVDIVSLPEQGIWSLQITEPDLGSDPGNPVQKRQAVPGRVIETNIGFRFFRKQVECGFQTMISDPDGTQSQAEVYRLAVVRRLISHPDFGLKHITALTHDATPITTLKQLKTINDLIRNEANQLPCVIFTHLRERSEISELPVFTPSVRDLPAMPFPTKAIPQKTVVSKPRYEMETFAKYGVTFCRTYLLDDALFEQVNTVLKMSAAPGDILVLEPLCFGRKTHVFSYFQNQTRREETMERLRTLLYNYPRNRDISFGNIVFLSAARENLLYSTSEAIRQAEQLGGDWAQRMVHLESQWKAELREKDNEVFALKQQLDRQRHYQIRLERQKEQLRQEQAAKVEQFQAQLAKKEEDIAYLKRKLSRPKSHGEIADWIEGNFSERLFLHPKAISLLEDKSAKTVSVDLICDALDFLATDYWERRYQRITTEEMYSRCSEKYGRPFEIKPTGTTTIEYTPAQYKVKCFEGIQRRAVDRPLDYHLRVGNDPENLLRIYFLHDDEKKLIVVGSLPRHLRAVTIR